MTGDGPRLETARLTLRPPLLEDLDGWAEFQADEESTRWIGGVKSRSESWRGLMQVAGSWSLLGFGMFSVLERDTGRWVGRVGPLHPEDWPGDEVGWGIARDAWGRGVIVVLNDDPRLARCLEALRRDAGGDLELLLAENGAKGDPPPLPLVPAVRLRRSENPGFAAAFDDALSFATGEEVLSLNPDTEVLPGCVAAAQRRLASDARIGAVAICPRRAFRTGARSKASVSAASVPSLEPSLTTTTSWRG